MRYRFAKKTMSRRGVFAVMVLATSAASPFAVGFADAKVSHTKSERTLVRPIPPTPSTPDFSAVPTQFSVQGVKVVSKTGSVSSGSAKLQIARSGVSLAVNFSYTDKSNWRLDVASSGSTGTFSPVGVTGLQIAANGFTGYLARTSGNISGSVSVNSVTWKLTSSLTVTGSLVVSATCGLTVTAQCPSSTAVTGPFLNLVGGTVNGKAASGSFSTDGQWLRIQATGLDDYSFGDSLSISSPTLAIWRGERTDSFNPNLVLPDLSSDNGGVNAEFCGGFTLSVPMLDSNSSSTGCARASKSGVVVGQVASTKSGLGSTTSAGSNGSSTANAGGVAWTNIPASSVMPSVTIFGNSVPLVSGSFVFSGTATIPDSFGSKLQLPSPSFDVVGTISRTLKGTSLTATGTSATSISSTMAPLAFTASKFDLALAMSALGNAQRTWSLSGSSTVSATVGYAGSTATIPVSLTATGSSESGVSIRATAGSVTLSRSRATALKSNAAATSAYIWQNAFGIQGFNLASLDASLSIDPSTKAVTYSLGLGVAVDPSAFPSVLVGSSIINGQLNVSSDGEKRCLLFGFDGGESGGVSIAGGAMVAHQFQVAVNSLSTPCSAQVNGSTVSVPANAKGLSFSSTVGDASFAISLAKSSTGYSGSVAIGDMTLGGIYYKSVTVSVSSNGSASSESFSATMETGLGNFSVSSGLSKAGGTTTQSLSASGTDLNVGTRKFNVNQLGFSGTFTVPASGCATTTFNANARGTAMGNQSYTVNNFGLTLRCNTVTSFNFNASFTHYVAGGSYADGGASKTYSLAIAYQDTGGGNASFSLSAGLSYQHSFNYKKGANKMSRTVTFSGNVGFVLTTNNSWKSINEGSFSGSICADADRVSGCASVSFATDGSFTFGLDLRVNPSFAGIWHWNWTV